MPLNLSTLYWMLFVSTALAIAWFGLQLNYHSGVVILAQATFVLLSLTVIERIVPMHRHWQWWQDRQIFSDIFHTLSNDLSVRYLTIVAAWALSTMLDGHSILPWPTGIASIAVGVISLEIMEYWRHRWLHKFDLLWRFHALHHHLNRLHIWRCGRIHIIDGASRVLLVFAPALLLGIPSEAITAWLILLNAIGPISHCNLDIRTPHWLNMIIATPLTHRLHHASNAEFMNTNLAPICPLIDKLFNTWQDPLQSKVTDVGVTDDFYPANMFAQLYAPFSKQK